MKLLNRLFGGNKGIIKNRKVTRARFLYLYVIISAIVGLAYFFTSFFIEGLPKLAALTPLYLIVGFVLYRFLVKNWKLIGLYISDMEQGRLLLFLNKSTHWTDDQKLKVVRWVYLKRRTVRKETHAKITNKLIENGELSKRESKMIAFKSVGCPQQMMLGFNEALLIHALIYAHQNIQILDEDLREIMKLTDEHILAFNLQSEYKKAGGSEYEKYMEIGKKNSEKLNK